MYTTGNDNFKVVPLIETIGTDKYKNFLLSPFNSDILMKHFKCEKVFEDENSIVKTTIELDGEENNIIVSDYTNKYYIGKKEFDYPININIFIENLAIHKNLIYWRDGILNEFEPKDILAQNEIKEYYKSLLNKIDKGHELL